jgi:hypothetical protein
MDERNNSVIEAQYNRAIEAYHKHYSRYNTWMNYYSLFVGALFIGYYSMYNSDSNSANSDAMRLITAIVGLLASICWLGSFTGYYHWLISYIKILNFHEKKFVEQYEEKYRDDLRIYSVVVKKDVKELGFSTQKITKYFIIEVLLAWIYLIILNTPLCCCTKNAIGISIIIFSVIGILYLLICRSRILSSVETHYNLKDGIKIVAPE